LARAAVDVGGHSNDYFISRIKNGGPMQLPIDEARSTGKAAKATGENQ